MKTVKSQPPTDDHKLVPVCSPRSPTELAVVLSLLKSEGIDYFVSNDHFGSLTVGPSIPLYNEKTILVPDSEFEVASALVAPPANYVGEREERGFTFFEKLRMAIEVVFFGWIIPMHGSFKENSDA